MNGHFMLWVISHSIFNGSSLHFQSSFLAHMMSVCQISPHLPIFFYGKDNRKWPKVLVRQQLVIQTFVPQIKLHAELFSLGSLKPFLDTS